MTYPHLSSYHKNYLELILGFKVNKYNIATRGNLSIFQLPVPYYWSYGPAKTSWILKEGCFDIGNFYSFKILALRVVRYFTNVIEEYDYDYDEDAVENKKYLAGISFYTRLGVSAYCSMKIDHTGFESIEWPDPPVTYKQFLAAARICEAIAAKIKKLESENKYARNTRKA